MKLLLLLTTTLICPGHYSAQEPFRISVNVHLVVLNATVRDNHGNVIDNLQKQDFSLSEDGTPQTIQLFRHEDLPVTVGLVVDHSGSMRQKINDVITAARSFVTSSSPEDQMFVVNFNELVSLGLPPSINFTNNPEQLAYAISNTPTTGQTALYDAIFVARERLKAGSRDKKVLVVISDGGDNKSKHKLTEVLQLARQSNILIYTVGIFDASDPDQNPQVLKRLALETGGEAFFPKEYGEVVEVCNRIARDIRHQYTLGYVSTNAGKPGAFRAIRVLAKPTGKGKAIVRTRTGYIAIEEPTPLPNEASK